MQNPHQQRALERQKKGALLQAQIAKSLQDRIQQVIANKAEVLDAFIAKYGADPDYILVEERLLSNNTHQWSVRRQTEEEHALYAEMGIKNAQDVKSRFDGILKEWTVALNLLCDIVESGKLDSATVVQYLNRHRKNPEPPKEPSSIIVP